MSQSERNDVVMEMDDGQEETPLLIERIKSLLRSTKNLCDEGLNNYRSLPFIPDLASALSTLGAMAGEIGSITGSSVVAMTGVSCVGEVSDPPARMSDLTRIERKLDEVLIQLQEQRGTKRKRTFSEGTQVDVECETTKKIRCPKYSLKEKGCTKSVFPQNMEIELNNREWNKLKKWMDDANR